MTERIYNFSAGPAVLPLEVLQQAQSEMTSLNGIGMSVMEVSHRSKHFAPFSKRRKAASASFCAFPTTIKFFFCKAARVCNSRWFRSIF
jgi:phosphoserine aminotransferase